MMMRRAARPGPQASLPVPRVVILIPCLNEEKTIGKVVRDFQRALPSAQIFVYDNGSSDKTAAIARHQGAEVIAESRAGKGHVVQAMFRDVQADAFLMVDGDDTYPADRAHALLEPVLEGRADMVVGSRTVSGAGSQFRRVNWVGNLLFRLVTNISLEPSRRISSAVIAV
jgi:glycosyltransferase involved in cell wall biosynthesis